MYAGGRGNGTGPDSCTIKTSARPRANSSREFHAEFFGFLLLELPRYYLYAGCIDLALTFSDVLYLRPTYMQRASGVPAVVNRLELASWSREVPRVHRSLSDDARPKSFQVVPVRPVHIGFKHAITSSHGPSGPVTLPVLQSTQHRQPRRQGYPPDSERQ